VPKRTDASVGFTYGYTIQHILFFLHRFLFYFKGSLAEIAGFEKWNYRGTFKPSVIINKHWKNISK
jgi:hypothetical protein